MAERNVTPIRGRFSVTTVIIGLIVVAALVLLSTSFFMVDQSETAVVTTFGKVTGTKSAGLHFKLPFGIQRSYIVPTEIVHSEEFGFRTERADIRTQYDDSAVYNEESTMLTGDLNIVDVEWIIQYKIVDPVAWLFQMEDKYKTIRDISQSVLNMLIGDKAILSVLSPARTAIENDALSIMNENFTTYGVGIRVVSVKLQNIVAPQGVQAAFDDVNKAEQDMYRFINEGKEAYNKEMPRVDGEADRVVQIAEGYASERVNKAKGDVARFLAVYAEYVKAPEVTRERLYYEMMEDIFKDATGVDLVDSELGNFIPLKNLGSGSGVNP
ncbi:MAG: FtsH protease activity modulator HflK [Spirochaetales bacterium]|nr:FtsH protease activity modulator HflK [Spirochaetales bacterium]